MSVNLTINQLKARLEQKGEFCQIERDNDNYLVVYNLSNANGAPRLEWYQCFSQDDISKLIKSVPELTEIEALERLLETQRLYGVYLDDYIDANSFIRDVQATLPDESELFRYNVLDEQYYEAILNAFSTEDNYIEESIVSFWVKNA